MKKQFTFYCTTFVLLILSTHAAQGQNRWSAGLRTGVDIENYQITTEDFRKDNYIWNRQVFLNKRMGQHFEMELTLNHHQKEYKSAGAIWGGFVTNQADSFSNAVRQQSVQLGIALKYYFYSKKNLSLYGTAGTTFAYISEKQAGVSYMQHVQTNYSENEEGYSSIFHRAFFGAGINYSVSPRIFLNANMIVSYKLDGLNHPGNSYYNRWTNGVLLGAGYRF